MIKLHVYLQKRNTLLVCCADGQVLEIERPDLSAEDTVHTFEITGLNIRTHQFKSVKSVLLVRSFTFSARINYSLKYECLVIYKVTAQK